MFVLNIVVELVKGKCGEIEQMKRFEVIDGVAEERGDRLKRVRREESREEEKNQIEMR